MENNKSLIVSKNGTAVSEDQKTALQTPSFSKEINEAWDLYREQLKRNFELMKVISEQQRVIEQFVSQGLTLPVKKDETELQALPSESHLQEQPELKYISYDRIKKLEAAYCIAYDGGLSRNDAVANHLNMIYILFQLQEATPEKWFMQTCVPESTAYRYATYMRKYHIIKSVRGKYMLSSIGRMLMESKADTPAEQEELCNKIKKEKVLFTMHQHIRVESLPENKEFFNNNYSGM